MEEPSRTQCWETMAEGARDVDAFIAVSRWFGDVMRERMRIDPERLHVVHIGVDPGEEPAAGSPNPPVLGYLARMSRGLGLGVLAEAFLKLKKDGKHGALRLHLSGGSTADDAEFLEDLKRTFAAEGAAGDVQFFDDFTPKARRRFFESLSILTVPTPNGVAFGTYILEALACGVPVVEPRVGSYPEIVEATGGGVLYEPNDPDTLARVLGGLLDDPGRRAELGRAGRESVVRSFSLDTMARTVTGIYRGIVSGTGAPAEKRA